ncbi:MAG: type 4a pilus biogenesis protein PilO [Bradymonadia bacterium]
MGEALEKFAAIPTAQKFLVLALLAGLIGVGWYFTFISDVEDKITTAHTSTKTLNKKLTDAQGKIANLKKFEEEVETLKRQREEMTDRLPADEEIASLLQKIHGQGKIVGLEINRFERQPPEVADLFVRIPVRMTLTGTFHQIATFFFYVGRLTRIVNVENISLARVSSKDGGPEGALTATCTATTFMYRPANLPVDGGK